MKKALLIIGIVIIVTGVLCLLVGILFKYISTHTLDGSAALYDRQRRTMMVHLITGGVITAIGTVCLLVRGILR